MTLAIIVQGINLAIRKRDSTKAVAPAIISIAVLVQIVSQMKDIIYRIFPRRMPVCVKIGKRVVAARINREANFCDQIMRLRRRFRATYRAFEIRVADTELVVILRVRLEFLRLDLGPRSVGALQEIEEPGGVPSTYNRRLSLYTRHLSLPRASTPCPWLL